jgi:hypothetical protein
MSHVVITRCVMSDVLITRRVMSDVLIARRVMSDVLFTHFVMSDILITLYTRCFDTLICVYQRMSSTRAISADVQTTHCVIFMDALNLHLQRRSLFCSNEIYVPIQAYTKPYGIISQKTSHRDPHSHEKVKCDLNTFCPGS